MNFVVIGGVAMLLAAFAEQKVFDDSDRPKDKRGTGFGCCESAAKVVFPAKLKNKLPFVASDPAGGVSVWDARTNACKRAGRKYRIYNQTVDICNCK